MKSLLCIITLLGIFSCYAASGPKVYVPIANGTQLGDIYTNTSPKDSLYIQELVARRSGHIPQGSQRDIDEFNEYLQKNSKDRSAPQPFANKTNSYWLDPNFQFGPGSVNDFGGNPNAQQMLQPYIF